MKTRHLVLEGILGNGNMYQAECQFKKCFCCLWVCGVMGCLQGGSGGINPGEMRRATISGLAK